MFVSGGKKYQVFRKILRMLLMNDAKPLSKPFRILSFILERQKSDEWKRAENGATLIVNNFLNYSEIFLRLKE